MTGLYIVSAWIIPIIIHAYFRANYWWIKIPNFQNQIYPELIRAPEAKICSVFNVPIHYANL